MARPPRYNPRDATRRRGWIYLAVLVFVLVDVLLIAWALGARTPPTHEPTAPIPTFTPQVNSTPSPTAAPAVPTVVPSRILTALNATTAWRATTGECPTAAARPEATSDSGSTWSETDATADVQVTALQSLTVVSESLIELVGLSAADCSAQFVRSFVAGDDYSNAPDLLGEQWYVDPIDRASVHTPTGVAVAPCDSVVALAPRTDAESAVLCAESQVFSTRDAGLTWSAPTAIVGAVNLAVTQMGYVIAAVGLPECEGVQLIALSTEPATATPTGCLPVEAPAETMQGNVAISEAAGTVWVWAGDSVMRSIDRGTSWQ
jgi:hypothetical protein